ncbi:MAG: alpha/beta hydrolase [Actinobacteria bacterium]|nr:alpha/beta hydrolase [Actinomycetota bacterium]
MKTVAADGVDVRAIDEGAGPCIVIVHGGLADPSAWAKVAGLLAPRFRVVRLHRRRYRLDLAHDACSIADEALDLRAVAEALDRQFVLVGHSSGAVVALEAMAAGLPGAVGAVLYEPPALLRPDEFGEAAVRIRADYDAGRVRHALSGYLRDFVQLPAAASWLSGRALPSLPGVRELVKGQVGDAVALNALGPRLDAYATITRPVLFLTGDRSPRHLTQRVHRLAEVLPKAKVATLTGQAHGANDVAPDRVADEISRFVANVLPLVI